MDISIKCLKTINEKKNENTSRSNILKNNDSKNHENPKIINNSNNYYN